MTNKEIAKTLGISPAALSLILNHKPGVSDQTRAAVLQKIAEMGYSHLIKPIREESKIGKTICFIVYLKHGKILNQHPFFLLLMESIESHARKFGYNIILMTMDAKSTINDQFESLYRMNPSGVILFATEMEDEDIRPFMSLPFPYVAIDNDFPYLDINTVAINNQLGTYQAIEYLIHQGHTNIGYFHSSDYINSFAERQRGYSQALKHFGLKLESDFIFHVRYSEEESYQDIRNILKNTHDLPSAFVCDDDTIAIGALRALTACGYSIPEDVSLIGFNDRPNSLITLPPLTSVNVPKGSFGSAAVSALVSLIDKRERGSWERSLKTRLGTQLSIRESVRKL